MRGFFLTTLLPHQYIRPLYFVGNFGWGVLFFSILWKCQYCGYICEPTIVLEAVALYDLWIWHAFFRLLGSNNDINVLEWSHIFFDFAEGRALALHYLINGHDYAMWYYLTDGIYPKWATFVKTISASQGQKQKLFAKITDGI